MTSESLPPALAAELRRLTAAELSPGSRLGYLALLLAASAMTAVAGALLITEPALPARTAVGFAAMIAVGVSWIVFAAWVLTRRRAMLARHRIVAGRMAVAFTTLFVAGAAAASYTTGARAAYLAAATGVVMLGIAGALLARAHRHVARLVERRDALERELGKRGAR